MVSLTISSDIQNLVLIKNRSLVFESERKTKMVQPAVPSPSKENGPKESAPPLKSSPAPRTPTPSAPSVNPICPYPDLNRIASVFERNASIAEQVGHLTDSGNPPRPNSEVDSLADIFPGVYSFHAEDAQLVESLENFAAI